MSSGSRLLLLAGFAVVGASPLLLLVGWLVQQRHAPGTEWRAARWWRSLGLLERGLAGVAAVALLAGGYLLVDATAAPHPAEHVAEAAALTQAATPPTVPLPGELAGLPRTSLVDGAAALAELDQMHGTTIDVTSGAIARYEGGRAELWVSTAADAPAAASLVEDMAARMAEGRSPFAPPERLDDPDVWRTTGLDQVHHFFARGTSVWWLSADPALSAAALAEALALAG